MSKFCTQCGNELKDDAKFCDKCGTQTETKESVELNKSTAKSQGNANPVYGHKIINGVDIDLIDLSRNYDETMAISLLSSQAGISIEQARAELQMARAKFGLMEQEKKGKKVGCGCLIVIVLFLGLIGLVAGSMSSNKTESQVEQDSAVFERIGYSKIKLKSGSNNRSFVFYTTETDEDKLIEHARQQMYTKYGFTYVHYYNDKEKAPDNTLFPEGENYFLNGYEEGRFLVYQHRPVGTEYLWDGEMKNAREITPVEK